jgi:ubiquitin carboxyl-terminal hydrolase 34
MKIDTDSTTAPRTPERLAAESEPPSEARSSRVTINLRNDQRPLDTIPSSPRSVKSSGQASHGSPEDDVKISIEESGMEMARSTAAAAGTPSSSSNTGSPPIEVISIHPEDDADFDGGGPQVTILQGMQGSVPTDPTGDFPFREITESFPETVTRLTQYLPTRKFPDRQTRRRIL